MTKKSSITISTVVIFILLTSLAIFTRDTDKYFLAGLHCMDLIFIQDRWAYHSPSDNVNNVRPEALKHLGDNVLSLISGITNDHSFPLDRFSDKELYDMKASQGTQDSKTVYFSILESSTIHQTRASAKAMYIFSSRRDNFSKRVEGMGITIMCCCDSEFIGNSRWINALILYIGYYVDEFGLRYGMALP